MTVSIPTSIGEISFGIPEDYPVPPIGGDFYFNYESVLTDLGEWEAVCSVLENNVLTVDRKEPDRVYLHEGVRPHHPSPQQDDYLPALQLYWEHSPWTSPPF